MSGNAPDLEQDLRWRMWQENGERANRIADKRIKILVWGVGVIILLFCAIYFWLGPSSAPASDHMQHKVAAVALPMVPTTRSC
jgi:hypothetical protein